jgi:raffinose/stachyose/melibiose transport system permease protein
MLAAVRRITGTTLTYLMLAAFAVTTLFPLLWMGYTSLKSNREITMNTFSLPTVWHLENYVNAWQTARIGTYFLNSVVVSLAAVLLTILAGAAAGFILAKFRFRLRGLVYGFFIIGMLIPLQSVLVPLFIQMRDFHLLDNPWSLILSYTAFGLPIAIFLMESFIRSFPDSLIEAAVLDGASIVRIFRSLVLPISSPVIATVSILSFLNNWKEFSFALIFLTKDEKKTLPLGLYNFLGAYTADYAGLMAALVIASVPLIVLYFLLQEQIIKGMTAGAVKG